MTFLTDTTNEIDPKRDKEAIDQRRPEQRLEIVQGLAGTATSKSRKGGRQGHRQPSTGCARTGNGNRPNTPKGSNTNAEAKGRTEEHGDGESSQWPYNETKMLRGGDDFFRLNPALTDLTAAQL